MSMFSSSARARTRRRLSGSSVPRKRISLKCTTLTFHLAANSSCWSGVQFCALRLNMSTPNRTGVAVCANEGRRVGTECHRRGPRCLEERSTIRESGRRVFRHSHHLKAQSMEGTRYYVSFSLFPCPFFVDIIRCPALRLRSGRPEHRRGTLNAPTVSAKNTKNRRTRRPEDPTAGLAEPRFARSKRDTDPETQTPRVQVVLVFLNRCLALNAGRRPAFRQPCVFSRANLSTPVSLVSPVQDVRRCAATRCLISATTHRARRSTRAWRRTVHRRVADHPHRTARRSRNGHR